MKELTKQWIQKANEDEKAERMLLQFEFPPHSVICFHLQQATEKWVKALINDLGFTIGKTHDIEKLINEKLIGMYPEFNEFLPHAKMLSEYGVEPRYPGDYPEFSKSDTLKALDAFEQIKQAILNKLKPE